MTSTTIRRAAAVLAGLTLIATAGCVRVELPQGEYESASEAIESGDTPNTTALSLRNALWRSANATPSCVQPEVLSLG